MKIGVDAIRKDILRADLNEVVPLTIQANAIGAAINLCIIKAHNSDNLEVKAECGFIVREIILSIDDSIHKKASDTSNISKMTKKYVDSLSV